MVGLVESVNHWVEERYGMPRHRSALLVVGSLGVCCVLSLLSYNALSDVTVIGMNFNALMEYLYEKILLPVGGLLIAVFVGWAVKKEATRDELTVLGPTTYRIWHALIRFVVPPAILIVLVMGISS
jgi:NSS family neurotransmitter:Na+ symporter